MKFYISRIKELVAKKEMSMYRLAKLTGVSHTTVSGWLTGKSKPRDRNVYLMAKAFNVPVSEISDLEETEDITAEVSGYFQGWGSSLDKNKEELEDPCARAMKEIENIKSEQFRLRTVTKAFMSTMQSMLYVKNYHGQYILANESYLDAIGLDVSINIIGKKDTDFMPQKIGTANASEDLSIINTGKAVVSKGMKFPFSHPKIKYCVMTKVPLKDKKLNIVGMVASFTDITAEHKIRRHDKMLNEAIKQCDAAIGITKIISHDKRFFVFANESLNKILGFTAHDLNEDEKLIESCILEEDRYKMREYSASYKNDFRKVTVRYKHPVSTEVRYLTFKSSKVKDSDLYYHWVYDETEKHGVS